MKKLYAEKLCPFCGGKPYLERSHRAFINGKSTRVAFVRCTKCNARSDRFKIEDFDHTSHSREAERLAIEAWDTRKPVERIGEMLNQYRRDYTSGLGGFTDELADRVLRNAIKIVKDGGGINK